MKKVFLLFALIFGATIICSAQKKQDVVYLTDGSVEKGKIISQIFGESVTIKTTNGEMHTINYSDIEKTGEIVSNNLNPDTFFSDVNLMASVGDFVIMGVDGVFGYRYHSFLELGARVSLLSFDCMNGDSKKSLAVPVMAHLSTNLLPNSLVSPFISLDGGYSIGIKDGKDGWYKHDYQDSKFKTSGLCYEASAGIGFDVVSTRMKIAFYFRRNSIQYINPDYNIMDRCYGLKLGLSF